MKETVKEMNRRGDGRVGDLGRSGLRWKAQPSSPVRATDGDRRADRLRPAVRKDRRRLYRRLGEVGVRGPVERSRPQDRQRLGAHEAGRDVRPCELSPHHAQQSVANRFWLPLPKRFADWTGWCAWQESNLLPLAPQASALSGELQAREAPSLRTHRQWMRLVPARAKLIGPPGLRRGWGKRFRRGRWGAWKAATKPRVDRSPGIGPR